MKNLIISLDGFDTPYTGCTTHLASLIILKLLEEGAEPIDYPWLVRLNPAVPWKTRGNGAVVIQAAVEEPQLERIVGVVRRLISEYDIAGSKAAAIILASDAEPPTSCARRVYERAVHSYTALDTAQDCLRELRPLHVHGEGRRSIIGAVAALGASLQREDHTFELITYRDPSNWLRRRHIDEKSVIEYDYLTGILTFLNYDYTEKRVLITPHGLDPVLYGVRGELPQPLLKALHVIKGEEPLHWTLFRTNQATNRHLKQKQIRLVRPYDNPIVQGRVREKRIIRGGHVLIRVCDPTGCIWTAFYRETGTLNQYARTEIAIGDEIEVGGAVKPHGDYLSLNAEYLKPYNPAPQGIDTSISQVHVTLRIPRTSQDLVLPSPSAFHHLMKPWERYQATITGKPTKPVTPVAGYKR